MSLENVIVSKEEQFINSLELDRYRLVLLDKNGMGTELYNKLENEYKQNPESFKISLKNTLFKLEDYIQSMAGEVLDKRFVDEKIIIFIKQEVLEEFLNVLCGNEEILSFRREKLKDKLTKIRKKQLENFDNEDLENVAKMIEQTLQYGSVKKLMKDVFDANKGEHTRFNLQAYLDGNIVKMELIARLIADYIIIYRDNSKIEDYISYLVNNNIQNKSIEEINEINVNFHISYMRKKFPQLEDDEIFNKIYEAYEDKGFLFQGINGTFLSNGTKIGLTGDNCSNGVDTMRKIDAIFSAHGINNIFLSKLKEIETDRKYYYITNDFRKAEHFSFHNPEYMSMLFSTGPYLEDEYKFDQLAFYMRDIDSCMSNIEKLCDRYNLSEEEKIEIIEYAKRGLNEISKSDYNGIIMTPKRIVPNSILEIEKKDRIGSLRNKLLLLLDCRRTKDYRCYVSIPPNAISSIKVLPLQEIIKNNKDKNNTKKFISVQSKDGNIEQLYYDIFIKSADKNDLDCIVLKNDIENPKLESLPTNDFPLTVDVISFSPTRLEEFDILNTNDDAVQPSFQSLMMMMAVNGVYNSNEGKELLVDIRKKFTPKKMSQYYYFLSNKFLEIAKNNNYSSSIRLQIIKRILGDLMPKAIYMDRINRYPVDIRPEFLVQTQYGDWKAKFILDKIANLQTNSKSEKNIEGVIDSMQDIFDKHYNFNETYRTMCEEWFENLGFEKSLKAYTEKLSEREES